MLTDALKLDFDTVPVVDLGPLFEARENRAAVARDLIEGCARVGFVYLANHGVAAADVDAIFATAREFHDLPLEAKMEVAVMKNGHAQGYLPGKNLGSLQNLGANLQEAFQIRRPLPAGHPDLTSGKPLHGPIPWPSAMPSLEARMMAYFARMDELSNRLTDLFELGLDFAPDTLQAYFANDMHNLRILHYPPQRIHDGAVEFGARMHTDTNAFTILAQDDNGGLEVRNRDGAWIPVPPIPGTFVLNVGEILKIWTDGILSSTVHRVINHSGNERYSVPFFTYPSYDALIQPLMTNPAPENIAPEDLHTSMPRHEPFIFGERKAKAMANITPGKVTVPDY
jgi:isopenicillin N synthase-like dioxygenase